MEVQPLIIELADWLGSEPGQYVRDWEQTQIERIVANVFGYHAIQIGLPQYDYLKTSRISFKGRTSTLFPQAVANSAALVIDPENMPFDTHSIDLLVLPHVLECSSNPHQVLREAERVLMPEGRIVISGFNPWSLWGARERIPGLDPLIPVPAQQQISLVRLKDWFKLLSFELDRGRFGCYAPHCISNKWLNRWSFMEAAGDRWWPICGAMYVVSAVKREPGMRLVGPKTKRARRRMRRATLVAGRHSL